MKRSSDRLSSILTLLCQYFKVKKRDDVVKMMKTWSIIDVGSGDGKISGYIADVIQPKAFYCSDILMRSKVDKTILSNKNISKYIRIKSSKINLEKESVDLILCLQSIHHFSDVDKMLNEIKRILKPNGFLFIREHNVPKTNTELISYLNQIHSEYGDNSTDINYMSKLVLKRKLNKIGFKQVATQTYSKKTKNPQVIYHSLFVLEN